MISGFTGGLGNYFRLLYNYFIVGKVQCDLVNSSDGGEKSVQKGLLS
jgi:hypothetical protein